MITHISQHTATFLFDNSEGKFYISISLPNPGNVYQREVRIPVDGHEFLDIENYKRISQTYLNGN